MAIWHWEGMVSLGPAREWSSMVYGWCLSVYGCLPCLLLPCLIFCFSFAMCWVAGFLCCFGSGSVCFVLFWSFSVLLVLVLLYASGILLNQKKKNVGVQNHCGILA